MKNTVFKLMLGIFAVALIFRLAFFLFALHELPPSSDEAWPALMGRHILQGELPVFYWGQAYMGAQQAYFDAALYPWLGCHVLTTRLYPLLFSFLFLLSSYWLARMAYDRTAGLIALALLAVPVPYLAMSGAISVPPEYLAVTTMGSLALALLAKIVWRTPGRPTVGSLALLGFLLGFVFWWHLVALSFIGVALLFLFLKDKLIIFRRAFWVGLAGFALGSLPFWLHNFRYGMETFGDVGRTVSWASSLALLRMAVKITLHFLVGMKVMLYGDSRHFISLPTVVAMGLGWVWVGLLVVLLVSRFKKLLRHARLAVAGTDGTALLLATAGAVLFLCIRSARSGWAEARFLMPLLAVLPVMLAGGLAQVRQWSRPIFTALLTYIIACHLWGNLLLMQAWSDPHWRAVQLDLPETAALHAFLEQQGITHAYAHYWIAYRLTFESQNGLICTEPYNERFPGREVQYLDQARAADRVAYITHPQLPFTDENFALLLRRIGGTYRQQQVGCFSVFYDFQPPYGQRVLAEIPRDTWRIITHPNPDAASLIIDGSLHTSWQSQAPQQSGMWVAVDLGQPLEICNLRFDSGRSLRDHPRGYRLESSLDGVDWHCIGEMGAVGQNLFWEQDQPRFCVGDDHYYASFAPVSARWLKCTLTASDPRWWWTIAELRAFGPADQAALSPAR
ncbi:MAG: discoidin domain-containing protein [Lentisphaerae bacterium]|nr:discoidin domain-containing protein [Lentisphaerota bacterium]